MNRQTHGIQIEFEEDSGSSLVVLQNSGVMRNTVLVGPQGFASWGNVSRGHDVQEVLVSDKV